MKVSTAEEFIKKSIKIHKNIYDYSFIKYINTTTKVKIICLIHGVTFYQIPKSHLKGMSGCSECASLKQKQTFLTKYGAEHPLQLKQYKEKTKQTNLERYGVEYPLQSEEIKEKTKQTNIEQYGVEYACQSEEIKKKIKQTNLERYGVEYACQSEEIKKKIKQTNLERYGVEYPLQSEEIKEKTKQTNLERYDNICSLHDGALVEKKTKQTNLERYGVEYACQSEEIKKKIKQTNLERYGVEYPLQSEEIKEKIKQTNLERYGVENGSQSHYNPNTLRNLLDKKWLYNQHISQKKSLVQISRELNIGEVTVGVYLHHHGIETQNHFSSIGECEVLAFVNSLNIETISNTRSIIPPYELDIYIPEYNLAIEYCGLYWHSEQAGKDKHYHERKYNLCKILGIQLLTIFEDEWMDKNQQVKNKIMSLFKKNPVFATFARKTQIIKVSSATKRKFYDKNHIQGTGQGSINIGLIYNDKLVACMSFIKRKDNEYELSRYATSTRVTGGFSKLLKYFINEYSPKSIISFADLRWSTGNLYLKTGWKIDKILAPDYSYSPDGKKRFHKFNYRRKNLPNLLKDFNPDLSEKINCDNNGILRIWDCGKIRFKYPLDNY